MLAYFLTKVVCFALSTENTTEEAHRRETVYTVCGTL